MSRTLKFLCFLFTDADSMLSYSDISGVSELHQLSRRIHRYKRSDESWPVTSWKSFFLCKVIKVIHFWIFLSLVGGQCVILMSSLFSCLVPTTTLPPAEIFAAHQEVLEIDRIIQQETATSLRQLLCCSLLTLPHYDLKAIIKPCQSAVWLIIYRFTFSLLCKVSRASSANLLL